VERASDAGTAGLVRRRIGRGAAARRAALRLGALAAPLVLAAYSIAGAVGAALALAPALRARGPLGRRRSRAAEAEREALGG
jgi:hypothetical protein